MSKQDKKLIAAMLFLHFGAVLMTVSFYGFYYKSQMEDCRRLNKKLELSDWAKGEVNKVKSRQKLNLIKQGFKSQGIGAEVVY